MRDKEIMKQIEEYYYLNHGNDEQGQFISNAEGMKEDIYDWCVFPYLERIKRLEEGLNDVRAWLTRTHTDDPRHPFYIYREVCDKALGEDKE